MKVISTNEAKICNMTKLYTDFLPKITEKSINLQIRQVQKEASGPITESSISGVMSHGGGACAVTLFVFSYLEDVFEQRWN